MHVNSGPAGRAGPRGLSKGMFKNTRAAWIWTALFVSVAAALIFNTGYYPFQAKSSGEMSLGLTGQTSPSIAATHLDCNFTFHHINASCPRIIDVQFLDGVGLGDRFMQLLVGLVYAIRTDGFLVNVDDHFAHGSIHGDYAWVPDFFKLNLANANMTLAKLQTMYPNLPVIDRPAQVRLHGDNMFEISEDFETQIATLRNRCHMHLRVGVTVSNGLCIHKHVAKFQDCDGASCYFADEPMIYEEAHHVLGCYFRHTDRTLLPELIYDQDQYNVFVHLRVGDIVLYGERSGGLEYFQRLKLDLDQVLPRTFNVHYYFFAESQSSEDDVGPRVRPPPGFAFLQTIFRGGQQEHVSYIKGMDVRSTIYHTMNADMIITTGSSFPLVGATLSSKVREHYLAYMGKAQISNITHTPYSLSFYSPRPRKGDTLPCFDGMITRWYTLMDTLLTRQ